jgi:MtfA peptidase
MPFDTTYHIMTPDPGWQTITRKGGKDTDIYVTPEQLTPELDSIYKFTDSLIQANRNSTSSYEVQKDPGAPYDPPYSLIFFFIFLIIVVIVKFRQNMRPGNRDYSDLLGSDGRPKKRSYLTYYGDELMFTDEQLTDILLKRFPYFVTLSTAHKETFLHRLRNFMEDKSFKIHSDKGFVEMPVMISASAIQLTFGLKKYLLPHFRSIHVYPQEFMRTEPVLCLLEGNVSGHRINLSWKHFLDGYENSGNGQNVGLHEMAHALYYQTFVVEENVDWDFRYQYDDYLADGNKVYHTETSSEGGLYSEYAEKNLQEFWAESVEIFFEKPAAMRTSYPQLYKSMTELLNQDPLNKFY